MEIHTGEEIMIHIRDDAGLVSPGAEDFRKGQVIRAQWNPFAIGQNAATGHEYTAGGNGG